MDYSHYLYLRENVAQPLWLPEDRRFKSCYMYNFIVKRWKKNCDSCCKSKKKSHTFGRPQVASAVATTFTSHPTGHLVIFQSQQKNM